MKDFSILDQIFEAALIVDKEAKIIYYNHHFSILSKLPPRKIKKSENLFELIFSHDEKIHLKDQMKESLSDNKTSVSKEGEIGFLNSDSIINTVVKIIPFEENFLIVLNDLSIEKNLFDKYKAQVSELKNSYKQLVHADKLKSIGELTAGISHEISNPLTIASGSTELLEIFLESGMLEENSEEVQDAIQNIQSSLLRINKITLNMKKFVYQDDDKKEYVELSSIINSSINLVRPSFNQEKMNLSFKDLSNGVIGFINDLGIEQVLVNLLKNSLDAIKNTQEGNVTIELDQSKDGESIFIRVIDNGIGIDKENEVEIFSPFFTTKEMGEGTGMGLSLSKQIIEAHQGSITYTPRSEKGSIFTIELPGVELSSYLDNETNVSNLENSSKIKALVIDNEVSVLNLLSSLFEGEQISIIGSSKPKEALKLLSKVDLDVVIADYNMPEMNATELATEIRKIDPTLPIIYLTSKDFSNKFMEDKSKLSISSLITKPFTKKSVMDSVLKAIGVEDE